MKLGPTRVPKIVTDGGGDLNHVVQLVLIGELADCRRPGDLLSARLRIVQDQSELAPCMFTTAEDPCRLRSWLRSWMRRSRTLIGVRLIHVGWLDPVEAVAVQVRRSPRTPLSSVADGSAATILAASCERPRAHSAWSRFPVYPYHRRAPETTRILVRYHVLMAPACPVIGRFRRCHCELDCRGTRLRKRSAASLLRCSPANSWAAR